MTIPRNLSHHVPPVTIGHLDDEGSHIIDPRSPLVTLMMKVVASLTPAIVDHFYDEGSHNIGPGHHWSP